MKDEFMRKPEKSDLLYQKNFMTICQRATYLWPAGVLMLQHIVSTILFAVSHSFLFSTWHSKTKSTFSFPCFLPFETLLPLTKQDLAADTIVSTQFGHPFVIFLYFCPIFVVCSTVIIAINCFLTSPKYSAQQVTTVSDM